MSFRDLVSGRRLSNLRASFLPIVLASLLPAIGYAQASYTGLSSAQNFGSQAITTTSAARSLTFSIAAGTQVGSVAVLTTGIANMDFANATGTTCVAARYSSTTVCSVNVTFTPQAAGLRKGAVVFFSKANNLGTVLGTVLVYGAGSGAQIAYGPSAVKAVDRTMGGKVGLGNPQAMTTDAAGNLFVVDSVGNRALYSVVKIPPNGAATTKLQPMADGLGLYLPLCLAMDGAGNLFIGDLFRRVVVVPVGGGAATAIEPVGNGVPMNYPGGLAVDGAGNLFVSDFVNDRVLRVAAGGGPVSVISPKVDGAGLGNPHGVFVDATGNLFIADLNNNRIVKVPADGSSATAIGAEADGRALRNPVDVALDAAGDLFVADNLNHRVMQIPSNGDAASAIDPPYYAGGLGDVYAVAVDSVGNLFYSQGSLVPGNNIVEELSYGANPTVNFATPTNQGSTDVADGIQTVEVVNIGNLPLAFTGISFPSDFVEVSGGENECTASTVLSLGQECVLSVEFAPQNGGALSESIVLTDNAPPGAGTQQVVKLTGLSERQAAMTSPAVGSVLVGPNVTFNWQAGTGATAYYLSLGSTGVGSTNVFNMGKRTVTSWPATGIPATGATIYARLTTYYGAIQMHTDYVYTAATSAAPLSPAAGTVLPGTTATFTWSAGTGAVSYMLWLGTNGAGTSNLYSSGGTTKTSVAVTKLPMTGVKVYARLYTNFVGGQTHADYVYTAHH